MRRFQQIENDTVLAEGVIFSNGECVILEEDGLQHYPDGLPAYYTGIVYLDKMSEYDKLMSRMDALGAKLKEVE